MINKCDICGGVVEHKYDIKFHSIGDIKYTQQIGLCNDCGFIMVQNPMSNEELDAIYKKLSRYEYNDEKKKNLITVKQSYIERCREQHSFIYDEILHDDIKKEVNSMLEIGAASGYNLSMYKNDIKNLFGIEPSKNNCENAKKSYDIDMFNGMFDEYFTKCCDDMGGVAVSL